MNESGHAADDHARRVTPADAVAANSSAGVQELVRAGLAAAGDAGASAAERAQMLMELAAGLQQRPKTPEHLEAAVELYQAALAVCPEDEALLKARITASKGTALQALPQPGTASLALARQAYEAALPDLKRLGTPEDVADAEMNLGLALQELAGQGRARMADAIAAYQRALRTFDAKKFPVEFAILQNNLAAAFLSMPLTDERSKMREALAVQCFEDALKVVNLIDHPREYAMLQNNLGNALQQVSTSHGLENRVRAIAAYDEALKVRGPRNAPLEYANTIANKANCLCTLPDDVERPELGNERNLPEACSLFEQAREIFSAHGDTGKAALMAEAIADVGQEQARAAAP
jgi:tetratricopeptide (TPR) repeat protein